MAKNTILRGYNKLIQQQTSSASKITSKTPKVILFTKPIEGCVSRCEATVQIPDQTSPTKRNMKQTKYEKILGKTLSSNKIVMKSFLKNLSFEVHFKL